jgi:hypothetical protein
MLALTLHLDGNADRHRFQVGVVDVGGDDHPPPRHFVANQRQRAGSRLGDVVHLFGDDALAGVVHLGAIGVILSLNNPFRSHASDLYKRCSARGWEQVRRGKADIEERTPHHLSADGLTLTWNRTPEPQFARRFGL